MENRRAVSQIPTWQLDQARKVQAGILPKTIPNWNGLSFSYEYQSLDAIGGDYLDFFNIKGNKKGLLIADVSGHGIPAAIITAMAKMSFSNHAIYYDSPREILSRVNQDIYSLLTDSGLYLTCFFLVIDQNLHITYTSAGHLPMIYYNNEKNDFEILKTEGLFLGMFEDVWETYEEKHLQLYPGDRIVLYTDGLIETRNAEGKQYGSDLLKDTVMFSSALPIERLTKMLISDVKSFAQESEIKDDISVLGIEVMLSFKKFQEHYENGKKLIAEHNSNWVKEFVEAVHYNQDHYEVLFKLGAYYYQTKNIQEARQCFERLLANKNHDPMIYFYLSQIFMDEKKYLKAIPLLKEIIKTQPDSKEALNNMGFCYYSIGNLLKAKEIYQDLMSKHPEEKHYQRVYNKIKHLLTS